MTTTYLQGAFRAPATATIRTTRRDTMATSDWVVTAGDAWDSVDELLADWTAQLVADFGAGWSVSTIDSAVLHAQYCTVTTSGPNYDVTWSHAGDGTAVRDWLGASGDLIDRTSGALFGAVIPSAIVPPYAVSGLLGRAVGGAYPRSQRTHLDGLTHTQHGADDGEHCEVTSEITIRLAQTSGIPYGHYRLLTVLDTILGALAGATGRLSVYHGLDGDQWVCRPSGDDLEVVPEAVAGSVPWSLWEVTIPLIVEAEPW